MNGFEYLNWKCFYKIFHSNRTYYFKLMKTVAAKSKNCSIHIFLCPTIKLVDKFNRQLGVADKRYEQIHEFPSKDRVNPLTAILDIISRSCFVSRMLVNKNFYLVLRRVYGANPLLSVLL